MSCIAAFVKMQIQISEKRKPNRFYKILHILLFAQYLFQLNKYDEENTRTRIICLVIYAPHYLLSIEHYKWDDPWKVMTTSQVPKLLSGDENSAASSDTNPHLDLKHFIINYYFRRQHSLSSFLWRVYSMTLANATWILLPLRL